MAGRFADPEMFRGYAALLSWALIARAQGRRDHGALERLRELEGKSQIRLAWICAPTLGVPKAPFTVWRRKSGSAHEQIETSAHHIGMDAPIHRWSQTRLASRIQVTATAQDPGRPVHLFALRPRRVNGVYEQFSAASVIAATSAAPAAGGVRLGVTCGGALGFVVVNGTVTSTAVAWLDDDVNDDAWQRVEIVGLPALTEIPDYRVEKQGFVDDLVDPVAAAEQRLKRGLPLVGWPGVTETFHPAPPWEPRDPGEVLASLSKHLLPHLQGLYAVPEDQQGALRETHAAPPPQGGSGTATLSPFAALTIPAMTEPALNLGTGFGTAYAFGRDGVDGHGSPLLDGLVTAEFMVTAPYDVLPLGQGPHEAATIIGAAVDHVSVPDPVGLLAARAALLPPAARDAQFRESVRVSWLPTEATAAMVAPGQAALCTFPPGAGDAEALMPKLPTGGYEALTLARRPVDSTIADSARLNVIHADTPLPFEGTTTRGYAVCVGDVFGLWSSWQDVGYTASAPELEPPRIVHVGLTTGYAGSAQCPSELSVEVSLGWQERTPRRIEIVAQYWPMATAKTDPPPLDPSVVPPAPLFMRTLSVTFAGDTPSATSPSTSVTALTETGEPTAAPGEATQGTEGRRYRVVYSGDALDFAAVGRWGVRVWARVVAAAPALPTPSPWSPRPGQPATAVAASPRPVVLPPPPPLPGVPMGSSPDAQGLSHVRLVWPPQATPPVQRVVVWETSESVVLSRMPSPSSPDYGAIPGARLVTLRAAYDGLSVTQQQALFRRVGEFDPAPGALDLTLPKGSRDIHFFVVTAVTTTGVESPWPVATGGGAAHEHVQAFMAPRVLQPAPPVARSSIDPVSGVLSFTMESASRIEVVAFEVFATRSEVAALDVMTMGPPLVRVPVTAVVPPADRPTDPISGDPVYAAHWSGGLPPAWEPWFVRVMAVPTRVIEAAGTRGAASLPSDVVRVATAPPAVPVLEPLVVTSLGDGLGFRVDTATSALERAVPAGEFTFSVEVAADAGGAAAAEAGSFGAVPLRSVAPGSSVSDPLSVTPLVRRQPRSSGLTRVGVWLRRSATEQPVTVSVTVTDPLGRQVTQTATIAAGAGVAPPNLTWRDVFAIAGRGVVGELTSDVPLTPEWTLTITASKPGLGPVGPIGPIGPVLPGPRSPIRPDAVRPLGRGRLDDLIHLGPARTMTGSWRVSDIPLTDRRVPPASGVIAVSRSADAGADGSHTYAVVVPLAGVRSMAAELRGPEGAIVSARWRA